MGLSRCENPRRAAAAKIPWRIRRVGSDTLSDMSDTDLELLARYTRHHAEDAFAEIVRRHLGLVHSAALRQVRSPQLAEEVAQSAFVDLARSAAKLKPGTILTAWLYQVTRRTAIDVVRGEASRQLREQIATEMNAMNATAADWTHIEPLLDEAMHELDDTDRAAVLLRYFENKSLREVGAALGASENAAQKRLARAVETLRDFFAKRGVTVGTSGLVVVISANAVQAAPAYLALGVATSALAASASLVASSSGVTSASTLLGIMTTATLKTTVAAVVLAGLTAGLLLQRSSMRRLQADNDDLKRQLVEASAPQAEASSNTVSVAGLQIDEAELSRLRAQQAELLRLRGQVGLLNQRLAEQTPPVDQQPKVWRNGESRRVDEFHDVGALTAEACFESLIWAVKNNPQRLMDLVHLPENLATDATVRASAGPDLAKMIALTTLWGDKPMQEVSLRGGGTVKYARNDGDQQTIIHDDLKSFFLVGRLLNGREEENRNNMFFGKFPEGWKLVIPDFSPPTVSKAAE